MNEHPTGMNPEHGYAEMAKRLAEVNRIEDTGAIYWLATLRGNQPRCKGCNAMLTPVRNTVVEAECPNCKANLRDNVSTVERR